ncbi:MAG: DUF5916 domain-containing protein [Acidobacteriota bacterium]|nr:DUF5916 domain-containing protein [Acidobacteriota bacterium]
MSDQEGEPSIRALAGSEPIVVDGVLDDAVWSQAEPSSRFVQHEPFEGEEPSERTEFRVYYTPATLYVGVRAYDSEPDKMIAREMGRDASLFRDDSVAILLDTFDDDRNAYHFETNFNGARTDALITDEGRDANFSWDGVWTVASQRDDEGWSTEFAIPFSTLRFDRDSPQWGMNVRRYVQRKNEEMNWAPIPLEVFFWRVSMAGELTGLEGIKPSREIDVKPFIVASADEDRTLVGSPRGDDTEVGLDVKWGVTKELALDLTYNTDFADTEVDDQRVNLTRFSLFFPEKREFFVENAGIFEFGLPRRFGGGGGGPSALMKIFHSRRIGLELGEEIPVEWGTRLTGRVGKWNIGVLDVVTDRKSFVSDREAVIVPETNHAVVRLKRNVGQRSSVGMIYTDRNETSGSTNQVAGVDVDVKSTSKTNVSAFVTRSDDTELADDEWAMGSAFDFRGREFRYGAEIVEATDEFNPKLGFLRRRDFRQYRPHFEYRPRIDRHGIRELEWDAELDYFARSSDGAMESREFDFRLLGITTTKEDRFRVDRKLTSERLFEAFEIQPGIVIPAGRYEFNEWQLSTSTNSSRTLSVFGRVSQGGFFDGERTSSSVSVRARTSRFISARTQVRFDDVKLPEGEFITRLYAQRIDLALSPDVIFNLFGQFNDSAELATVNVRFNWIYRPGADLFVVYNHNWEAPHFDTRSTARRQLVVKFTYLLQG